MSIIIDRRLNSKKKSTVNRQRFLRRYRSLVKDAVQDAVDQRSITDIDSGSDIHIPTRDLSEPFFIMVKVVSMIMFILEIKSLIQGIAFNARLVVKAKAAIKAKRAIVVLVLTNLSFKLTEMSF